MTTPDLRPLSFGELLDRTFSLYRKHFWIFVGIMAIPQVFITAASIIFQSAQGRLGGSVPANGPGVGNPAFVLGVVGGVFLGSFALMLVYSVTYAVALGATTFAVSEFHLGHSITIREAYRKIKGRGRSLFNLFLMWSIRIFGCIMTLILAPLGVLMALWYAVSVPALVLEKCKPGQALKRSRLLTDGFRGRIFVTVILMLLISWTVAALVQGPFSGAMFYFQFKGIAPPFWLTILTVLAGGVAGSFTGPLLMIALVLIYYDIRVRKEGYDLQLMAEALGSSSTAPAQPVTAEEAAGLRETSVIHVLFLSLITLGIYVPVWYLNRRRALNNLQSSEKLSALPFAFVLALFALMFCAGVASQFVKFPIDLDNSINVVSLVCGITLLIQAFKVRRILVDHFTAKILPGPFASTVAMQTDMSLSGVATFFLGILYLQHKINRLLEAFTPAAGGGPVPVSGPAPQPQS